MDDGHDPNAFWFISLVSKITMHFASRYSAIKLWKLQNNTPL